jgi:hypothetical protein
MRITTLKLRWLFQDPPNVAVFTTVRVLKEHDPVLLVTRDSGDGVAAHLKA